MKKLFMVLALVCIFPLGSALAGCGESYLCCEAREGYYVSQATCTGEPPNQIPWTCTYVACSGGGSSGGTGGTGSGGDCDPDGGAWWVGCDPFAN